MCFKRASDRNWWSFPGFSPSFNGDATVVCLKIGYSMVLPTWCVSSCDVLCKVAIFSGIFLGIPPFQTHFDHRCACTTRNKRLLPPANGADGYAVKTIDDVTHKWNQMDRSKHCFFGEYPQETNMVFKVSCNFHILNINQFWSIRSKVLVLNPGCAPWSPRSKTTKMWRDAARICPFSLEFGGLNWGKKQRILI